MAATDVNEQLNQILKKSQEPTENKILPDEIASLTSAFLASRPDANDVRPKAYVVLSAICQGYRNAAGAEKDAEVATRTIIRLFQPRIVGLLGETDEPSLLTGVCSLTALFQVDPRAASAIFIQDGLVENLMDSVDLSPSALLCQEVAHLLGQAFGHEACRAVVTPQIIRWLEFKSRQSDDLTLRGASSVVLIKLSKGAGSDSPEDGTAEVRIDQTDELAQTMVDIIASGQSTSAIDAVEGLAYLSTDPTIKEDLAQNPTFLKQLFALVPSPKRTSTIKKGLDGTLIYGIIVVIYNITAFRPRFSEEQSQVEKLKRMAKASKGSSDAAEVNDILDNDEHVKARIHLLISAGVLPVFPAATVSSDSPSVRLLVGKTLLNIVEDKENRGKVLQAGGSKVLQTVIKQALSQSDPGKDKQSNLDAAELESIQALAKLAITSAPVQVLGPNVGAMYDVIRPFSILLQHPSSNLLQRFEAIMALTNLASHSADLASRIAKADGLLNRVELLLLEDHTLIRRASVELICNLIAGSEETFERYSGETSNSANKIHVLLALSDVEDLPTRLAASGALATVTAAPTACKALVSLQFERHRFLPVMTQLIDPSAFPSSVDEEHPLETDPGLVHRGVVCVANVFMAVSEPQIRQRLSKEAQESGLLQALSQLIKGQGVVTDPSILQQAAGAIKALLAQ
ncbi:hypothetical protein NLJ89_g9020 [Agrocybe chaxingu]|uniref:UNC-45/Cro1/She4 central domain-containing protein n=1 Tax=Agrocybe chaxingu TaxID=84603 RepID=A0A9W8JU74_9AGAR|nr:hypothetical protein NLJ89_g9020 [Agrocybe chaxingu]